MKKWFSYDPGLDRMSFHETADQAKAAAQEYLDASAEVAADEGWPDETPWICWGQLMGKADLVSSEPDPSGRFDTIDKYELTDLREPPEMDHRALLKAISLDPRLSTPPFEIGTKVISDPPVGVGERGTVIDHCRDLEGEKVKVQLESGEILPMQPANRWRRYTEEDHGLG